MHEPTMHVGVIASMKKGLEHFIWRELKIFSREGVRISLFHTKLGPGLYGADENWTLNHWTPLLVLLMQPIFLLRAPKRYLVGLVEAARYREFVDYFLAWYFSDAMSKVDVIYATFGDRKLYIGYFCKQIVNKPLVVCIHAYELYCNPRPRLFPRALAACDQVITVTEYNREYLESRYGVDPSRIRVVRISVDLEDYCVETKFVVLIVAYFGGKKGHDTLFEAVKKLGRDDIEIWVVGDRGTDDRVPVDVVALGNELGMTPKIAFFGKLSQTALKAVYRQCDVFCLPSRVDSAGSAEGFPTVIAEAMAFGKPVISTRHVEIPRILHEIVVEENDVDGLADAILTLYQSSALRKRLGLQNRDIAEKMFSTNNAKETVSILKRVTKKKHAPPKPQFRPEPVAMPQ